jgi:hypothetical protein
MDENGQVTNPQPHTKQDYEREKKREKKELKHNQKADKAARKTSEHQGEPGGAAAPVARWAFAACDRPAFRAGLICLRRLGSPSGSPVESADPSSSRLP